MGNEDKRASKSRNSKWNEERRTKLDKHEEQKFVDDIPMEDLKIEAQDEKKKTKSKDDSQSDRKYKKKGGL
ncbi:hypothetical protein [Oceanobacillus sojae]|uniref:Uncharacterized protein n=1 Tax=Oceanobacillus sojae TaxID=582851 RepID=A0A511ZEN4_9BACI|nr:hypothetical protein [Oceanobacillus sojae]GEN85871.1 hypothetical protein OSO01_06100 [Oceanobacillus sojae]